jgi:hypothetical protein
MTRGRVRVRFNYAAVALVVAIAIGFITSGPWWGALLVLSFIPLAWARARIEGAMLTDPRPSEPPDHAERLAYQLADVRASMEVLRQQFVAAWNEVDRLTALLAEARGLDPSKCGSSGHAEPETAEPSPVLPYPGDAA